MLSAETSALVAGGMRAQPPAASPPVLLRVVRPVMVGGLRVEPGQTLSVDKWFAAELITAGKAERIAPVAAAATAAIPEAPPAAKPQKDKKHVEQ